ILASSWRFKRNYETSERSGDPPKAETQLKILSALISVNLRLQVITKGTQNPLGDLGVFLAVQTQLRNVGAKRRPAEGGNLT
ncbi:MAG: hypothetical protein ACYTBZ_28175, partial [Planctomycetota bacterium]